MKITFTCKKCGFDVAVYTTVRGSFSGLDDFINDADLTCPRCNPPKPTYGPLTVEMVAEAVAKVSSDGPTYDDECRAVARFVIRLVNECVTVAFAGHPNIGPDPRDWLLKLAREP